MEFCGGGSIADIIQSLNEGFLLLLLLLWIVMEFCGGGSIADIIQSLNEGFLLLLLL